MKIYDTSLITYMQSYACLRASWFIYQMKLKRNTIFLPPASCCLQSKVQEEDEEEEKSLCLLPALFFFLSQDWQYG